MQEVSGNTFERILIDDDGNEYFAFSNGYSILSNYHYSPFIVDGIRYRSMEQYMQAQKALCANDYEAYQNIMDERSASKYKGIAITGLNYDRWRQVRLSTMIAGLTAKFQQNDRAANKLASTEDRFLLHTTTRDRIMGTGLNIDDDSNMDPEKWRGLNDLGKELVYIRDVLKLDNGNDR